MIRQFIFPLILINCGLAGLWGCATPAEVREYPNQQAITGKSKSQILACAGNPLKKVTDAEITLLRYYKEAPMLEESRPFGKGSAAAIHHGCWATVILENDRVVEVRYRFVPPAFDASDECEEIFEPCVP
ncbi:MAG: hypothetical protein HY038_05250 [Nitrospirae bacterium]|nr:hypothetical protein [Nitrospirota bacterium]